MENSTSRTTHAPLVVRYYQQIRAIAPVKRVEKELQHHDADIHGALCHRQGSSIPFEGNAPSYAQLYIYDPSYVAQRLSERNENLDNEIIDNLSTLLSQCNPLAGIYYHTYEILSNHESSSINSEDRANNNGYAESGSPYIIISSSMRMRLIEGGDRRTHNLPTMEEVAAVIPIEYSNRSCRDIVLTLRSSSRNDSLR
ncbi:hypothetical protein RMATCC62417_17047 [Rhizopus microsporus]|nr:hypothetical protein RMATCC62417_17047 [Rhizopus microsporus]